MQGSRASLNALAGREAAIVYDEPGTTRDVIEVSLDLDGYPFVLRDTAGLREAASPVEQEGIRRTLAAAESADLVLVIRDISVSQSFAGRKARINSKISPRKRSFSKTK